MLTLLFVLFLVGTILCINRGVKSHKTNPYNDGDIGYGLAALFCGIATLIVFVALLCNLGGLKKLDAADARIALYEERNENINQALADMIVNYMDYEGSTFEKAKLENVNVAVAIQAYPDLKAQPLVQQQIDTYLENEKEITRLKEQKIDRLVTEWWIHFNIFSKGDK